MSYFKIVWVFLNKLVSVRNCVMQFLKKSFHAVKHKQEITNYVKTPASEVLVSVALCHKYPLTFFLTACTSRCKDYAPLATSSEEHLNLAEIFSFLISQNLGSGVAL